MSKHFNKAVAKRKILFLIGVQLYFLTGLYSQVTFDPQPIFFRNQREMPLVNLATKQDIIVSAYGAVVNDGINDLTAIQAAITAARSASSASNPVRVVFQTGTYDLMPTSVTARHSLFVTTANNIVFEGNGAEIRNHNPSMGFFEVRSCTNVIFKNLNFDYAVLPFTQGVVTSKNEGNNTFTVKIDNGFPALTEPYFTTAPERWGCLKDVTGKLKAGADNLYPYIGWTEIAANTFRISTPSSTYTSKVAVGDYFVQIARNNGRTVFNTVAGKNITYLDINIYASPAGSFNGQDNREFNIINCKVIPKPGSGRVHSGNADIVHITGGAFGPWVQGCRFEGYTDDAVNLKHTKRDIIEIVSPTVLRLRFRVAITDNMVLFNPRTGLPLATPTAINSVVDLGNNIFEVTFNSNHNATIVGEHQTADKVYILNSACESAVFRNNVFKNGRRYGILLQSSYAQIKDCTFENLSSSGVKIENGADWGEGYIANNIEITNNTFTNCGFDADYISDPISASITAVVSKLKSPCTTADIWCGTESVLNQSISNITITNNTFTYNKTGINLQNINGATVTNNTFTSNPADITRPPGFPAISLLLSASSVLALTPGAPFARVLTQLPINAPVVFQGTLTGTANLQFSAPATFTAGSDNSNFNADLVFTSNAVNVIANTTANGAFLKTGQKVQVNNTNCSLTINGANSCRGNINVGGSNAFALNINANQEAFGTVTVTNGPLTITIAPTVTNLSFANSAAIGWGTGALAFTGFQPGKIRFGTTNTALTSQQLAQITADGTATGQALALDANGYLVLASTLATKSFDTKSQAAISYPTLVDNVIYFSKPQNNVEIFTVSGKKVLTTSDTNGIDSVTTSELSAGVYFIVFDGIKTEKFIKK